MAGEAEFLSGTDVRTALVVIHGLGLRGWQYVDIDGRARVEGCIDIGATSEVEAQTKALQADPKAAKARAFLIAITAWAAKFSTSAICLSVKGRTSWR
jgi:hypothetical protein